MLIPPHYTLSIEGIMGDSFAYNSFTGEVYHELSELQAKIADLEQQITELPAGSVTKKTINGNVYFYRRWTENKKRREKYIPAEEVDSFRKQIERQKHWKKN